MTTHRIRLANLERLAAMRPVPVPDMPERWPTLADLPTVRWQDADAVSAFLADLDLLTRHDAAHESGDFTEADPLATGVHDASLRVYGVIPRADETPDDWRARLDRLPVVPTYVGRSATW